jgi:hypothetical protein
MPFSQETKERWKNRIEEHFTDPGEPMLNDYYQGRQEESTNAGIIVGLCLLISTIIYFVSILRIK